LNSQTPSPFCFTSTAFFLSVSDVPIPIEKWVAWDASFDIVDWLYIPLACSARLYVIVFSPSACELVPSALVQCPSACDKAPSANVLWPSACELSPSALV
jgi:hypothetical protein